MTEEELVRGLKKGDRISFDLLYEKYKNMALRTAYLITGNRSDSEDVVQDTFVKIWMHCRELKNEGGFKAWMMQILVRTAYKSGKKKSRELADEEILKKADQSQGASFAEQMIVREEAQAIAEAVRELPVRQRTVVALYYYQVSGGVFATGRAVSLTSHHDHRDDIREYRELSEVERQLGYTVDAVEEFANGYRFDHMELDDVKGKDGEGNEVYAFKSLDIVYQKSGENRVNLVIEKPVEAPVKNEAPDAVRVCGDITVYYDTVTNKQVPPDYVLTEEDKAREAEGDFYISVGTQEVEIHQNQTVTWDKEGVRYLLLGFDLNLSAGDMLDMAEEIIGNK